MLERTPTLESCAQPAVPPSVVKVGMPFESKEKTDLLEVAKVVGEDVATYSNPPALLKLQRLAALAESDRVSCAPVEDAMVNTEKLLGVEVPIAIGEVVAL